MNTPTVTVRDLPGTNGIVQPTLASAATTFRAVAFWSAVVLPLFHLAMFATGHNALAMGLMAANAVALVAGHDHNQPE